MGDWLWGIVLREIFIQFGGKMKYSSTIYHLHLTSLADEVLRRNQIADKEFCRTFSPWIIGIVSEPTCDRFLSTYRTLYQ